MNMPRQALCVGLAVLCAWGTGPSRAQAAQAHGKHGSVTDDLLKKAGELHRVDLLCQDALASDEYRKSLRRLLVTQHQALPRVAEEPQHLATEQRHQDFIDKYSNSVEQMRAVLQKHAELELSIKKGGMKNADLQSAVTQWTSECEAMQNSLKSYDDEFKQIGQDYLDIFQDHGVASPGEVQSLLNR